MTMTEQKAQKLIFLNSAAEQKLNSAAEQKLNSAAEQKVAQLV